MNLRILLASLLATGTLASQSSLNEDNLSLRDTSNIDTGGDQGLAEWLAATKRTNSDAALRACPSSCSDGNMFLFPNLASLSSCNQSMVLDLAIQNNIADGQQSPWAIKACTADGLEKKLFVSNDSTAALCSTPNHVLVEASIKMSQPQSMDHDDQFSVDDLLSAGHQLVNFIASQKPSCTDNVLRLGYSRSSVVGLFAGAEIHQHGITSKVLDSFLQYVEEKSVSKTMLLQLCGVDGRGADYGIGIIASSAKNLPFVQTAVKAWADGRCVSGIDADKSLITVTLRIPSVKPSSNTTVKALDTSFSAHMWSRSRLVARADCTTTTVIAGDGCWAVADRCAISQDDLEKYNPQSDFCNTLIVGQKVCCSSGTLPQTIPSGNSDGTCKTISVVSGDSCGSLASKCGLSAQDFTKANPQSDLCSSLQVSQPVCCTQGKLPDLTPKPNADGTCFTYTIKTDDNCAAIAVSHGLTVSNIEDLNKNTWGWNGCDLMWVGTNVCLSTGDPPMPAPVSNAVCGPTVPGTEIPSAGTNISTLNPCPLKSATGAPGTSAPGTNGCIANCGRDIIKGPAPSEKIQIAYFESWNQDRECLTMSVGQINPGTYTHIHFAFADITPDFQIDVSKMQDQFDIFKDLTDFKRIISFGGWDFSTAPGTFQILREAVKPGNRDIFQENIIAFVNEYNLDGIDIDWEYPGAPDIPGIPAGDPDAGMDYYQFLANFKAAVGTSKTASLAAPASYWYLQAFPIEQIGKTVDYIVYMTYDLHGQWDYGNQWTSSGCPTGNCLRSHINDTETKDALSMITKAGVPSNKVVVGVASYGRSFKMVEAGCDGPMCLFSGSPRESNAAKGRCTGTAGYISNAEIYEILFTGNVNTQIKDAGSNIFVYNDTEWVAWMDDDTKAERSAFYDSYNFAGTSDWAVDLQEFMDGSGGDDYPDNYEPEIDLSLVVHCSDTYKTFEDLESSINTIPTICVEQYLVDIEIAVMEAALAKYKDLVDKGYDEKFNVYKDYVAQQVPDQVDEFMASGKADKYFKCQEVKPIICCKDCQNVFCGVQCTDESEDCVGGVPGTFDITCPTTLKDGPLDDVDLPSDGIPNATYTLTDPDGFWKEIGDEYGILQDWITFGKKAIFTSQGCQFADADEVQACLDNHTNWWYNYPLPGDVEVPNPKDLVGKSYDAFTDLLSRLKVVSEIGPYDELMQWGDVLDSSSLPASTVQAAVDSMDKVVKTADDIEKAEREEFIVDFITGLLFIIPGIGEALAPDLVVLRSLLILTGKVGDLGLLIYGIVEDPDNAFMAVFSYLIGEGLSRGGFKDAAGARRSLKDSDIANLGSIIKNNLDEVEKLRGSAHVCKL